jgi:hypothetical protein
MGFSSMQRIKDYSMITSLWKTGAERQVSAAAGSGSDAGADAVSGRLHTLVRLRRGTEYPMQTVASQLAATPTMFSALPQRAFTSPTPDATVD